MSNSPLATYERISPNHSVQPNKINDRISIHVVVGQWTAKQIADYFAQASVQAAPNYGIGCDGSISLCVEEKDRSHCTSSRSNDSRSVTIEVASDTKHPYAVTDAALSALKNLLTDICQRNGKTKLLWFGNKEQTLNYKSAPDEMVLTVHRWFANKACPGDYLYGLHAQIASEVTQRLAQPIEPAKPWYQDAADWAVAAGIVLAADRPLEECTRAEVWTMLQRFEKYIKSYS